jgi:hypothetical protein
MENKFTEDKKSQNLLDLDVFDLFEVKKPGAKVKSTVMKNLGNCPIGLFFRHL